MKKKKWIRFFFFVCVRWKHYSFKDKYIGDINVNLENFIDDNSIIDNNIMSCRNGF